MDLILPIRPRRGGVTTHAMTARQLATPDETGGTPEHRSRFDIPIRVDRESLVKAQHDNATKTGSNNSIVGADSQVIRSTSISSDPAVKPSASRLECLRHELHGKLSHPSSSVAATLKGINYKPLTAYQNTIRACRDVDLFIALAELEIRAGNQLGRTSLREIKEKSRVCVEPMNLFDAQMLHELELNQSPRVTSSAGLDMLMKLRIMVGDSEVFMDLYQTSRTTLLDGSIKAFTLSTLMEMSIRFDYAEQVKLLEDSGEEAVEQIKADSLEWVAPETVFSEIPRSAIHLF